MCCAGYRHLLHGDSLKQEQVDCRATVTVLSGKKPAGKSEKVAGKDIIPEVEESPENTVSTETDTAHG